MGADDWEEAGLYDPGDARAGERRALLEYLSDRGATIEQMQEAHRLGSLPALAGELVLGSQPATSSLQEVARRGGVSVERLERVLLAVGVPVAGDSGVPADLDVLMSGFEEGVAIMGEDAILAFTRVLGAAATNIAEAAVALFYAEVGPGSSREGPDELSRAKMAESATLAFTSVPDVLTSVLLTQFDRARRRALMSRGWSDPAGADGELVALGFVDLVASTAWAAGLGLREQSLALSRFESAAWSSAVLSGGRVIKMIGDEVFFAAPSADAACRIGIEVCRAVATDSVLPPARGAVGYGRATPREGDYFGPLVNLVARLVKVAAPGMLVVTEDVAASLSVAAPDRWDLHQLEPQLLRGLEQPVPVFTADLLSAPRSPA